MAKWFGPATVSFPAAAHGNPYDPAENDAWVVFSHGSESEKRLAYFDAGTWKSVLVARHPGTYRAVLYVNGKPSSTPKSVALQSAIADGYVRKGGYWGFQFDSGKLYWPFGHNLGWQSGDGFPDLTKFLGTMGKTGMNWSRIWACTWDGKNPWWPNDGVKIPIGQLWPKAIARWDAIVKAAEGAGIHFQFVLFHHGEFSSTTDSNWKDNPWNAANGGFLRDPVDFFTDARAKQLSREWVRYAIARWGSSPAIMSWEIFNEVQWTDAVNKNHKEDVGAWHDDMARFIRKLDPVGHLVTTSSELSLPIWREMDYWQPHGYPARIESMVLTMHSPDKRPLFFGEVGPGQLRAGRSTQVQAVRDGIWSGLFALQAGAAEYWSWDLVPRDNLLHDFATAKRILNASGVLSETGLQPLKVDLHSPVGAILVMAPGAGWEPNKQFEFNLPQDATTGMGRFSAYFQGKGHMDMRPRPITFRFNAARPGAVQIAVTGISGGGGNLKVTVNGADGASRSWAAGTKLGGPDVLEVPFPAGAVTLKIDNDGPDWVQLGNITVPGIAPDVSQVGIGNRHMIIMRLERPDKAGAPSILPTGVALVDGTYTGSMTDLTSGLSSPIRVTIKGGRFSRSLSVAPEDSILWLKKR